MANDIKDIVEIYERTNLVLGRVCNAESVSYGDLGASLEESVNNNARAITALTTLSEDNAAMKLEIERLKDAP